MSDFWDDSFNFMVQNMDCSDFDNWQDRRDRFLEDFRDEIGFGEDEKGEEQEACRLLEDMVRLSGRLDENQLRLLRAIRILWANDDPAENYEGDSEPERYLVFFGSEIPIFEVDTLVDLDEKITEFHGEELEADEEYEIKVFDLDRQRGFAEPIKTGTIAVKPVVEWVSGRA